MDKKIGKQHVKNAERRLKFILWMWEEEPTLTLKELILSLGKDNICSPDRDMRLKEIKDE